MCNVTSRYNICATIEIAGYLFHLNVYCNIFVHYFEDENYKLLEACCYKSDHDTFLLFCFNCTNIVIVYHIIPIWRFSFHNINLF